MTPRPRQPWVQTRIEHHAAWLVAESARRARALALAVERKGLVNSDA